MADKNNIPKHWQVKKLGEVCEVKSGKNQLKVANPEGKYPIYGSSGIFGYADEYICDAGTTIIGRKGTINKPIYVTTKLWNVDTAFGLCSKKDFDSKFLYYFCSGFNFHKLDKSTTIPSLAKSDILSIEIPIPPLPEQKAIVAKIEELLSDLENGRLQLLTAQEQLKVYRQSLLNTIVTNKNTQRIEHVIEKLDQGWSPKCLNMQSKDADEWAVIKTSAIQHGHFIPSENKSLPKQLKPRDQHELKIGDILITRAGPRVRVGVCCMVKNSRPRLINCDKVYRIKVNVEFIKPEYFELILNTPFYRHEIEKMKTGISDSGVNLTQTKFLKIGIPIPSLQDQQLIINDLEKSSLFAIKWKKPSAKACSRLKPFGTAF